MLPRSKLKPLQMILPRLTELSTVSSLLPVEGTKITKMADEAGFFGKWRYSCYFTSIHFL